MSLAAVLTLDLSEYGQISTPRDVIVDALHQVNLSSLCVSALGKVADVGTHPGT